MQELLIPKDAGNGFSGSKDDLEVVDDGKLQQGTEMKRSSSASKLVYMKRRQRRSLVSAEPLPPPRTTPPKVSSSPRTTRRDALRSMKADLEPTVLSRATSIRRSNSLRNIKSNKESPPPARPNSVRRLGHQRNTQAAAVGESPRQLRLRHVRRLSLPRNVDLLPSEAPEIAPTGSVDQGSASPNRADKELDPSLKPPLGSPFKSPSLSGSQRKFLTRPKMPRSKMSLDDIEINASSQRSSKSRTEASRRRKNSKIRKPTRCLSSPAGSSSTSIATTPKPPLASDGHNTSQGRYCEDGPASTNDSICNGSPLKPERKTSCDIFDAMPALIDDCLVRDDMIGNKGSNEWNITEDTPMGHAEDKLVIVRGIEGNDQSAEWLVTDEDESTDDVGSASQPSVQYPRTRTPPEDQKLTGNDHEVKSQKTRTDRFSPQFKNSEMWAADPQAITQHVSNTHSSRRGAGARNVSKEPLRVSPRDTTPRTLKRRGGKVLSRVQAVPDLEHSDHAEAKNYSPGSPTGMETRRLSEVKGTRRKKYVSPDSIPTDCKRRSSPRKRVSSCGSESNSNHKMPSILSSASLSTDSLSPMTKSSSMRNTVGNAAGSEEDVNKREFVLDRKPNKSLDLHVESHIEFSLSNHISIGASTISTNFSVGMDDKSVTERSLFRPTTAGSGLPQIPQRRSNSYISYQTADTSKGAH